MDNISDTRQWPSAQQVVAELTQWSLVPTSTVPQGQIFAVRPYALAIGVSVLGAPRMPRGTLSVYGSLIWVPWVPIGEIIGVDSPTAPDQKPFRMQQAQGPPLPVVAGRVVEDGDDE